MSENETEKAEDREFPLRMLKSMSGNGSRPKFGLAATPVPFQ